MKKIISIILLIIMLTTLLTGCKKNNNIYAGLNEVSAFEKFTFEINANVSVDKVDTIEIETETISPEFLEETTSPTESVSESIAETESSTSSTTPQPDIASVVEYNAETPTTETISSPPTDNTTETIVEEPTEPRSDENKKEEVRSSVEYSIRIIGTYLGPNNWEMKLFCKDVNAKGYTNITNLYKNENDIYVDVRSMIDALDYFSDADGALISQYDFSKGNFIKTNIKEIKEILNSEQNNTTLNNPTLINSISKNSSKFILNTDLNIEALKTVFAQTVTIAQEVATTIENQNNDKKSDNEFYFTANESDGFTFTLKEGTKTTEKFVKDFGVSLNKNLNSKLEEVINNTDSETLKKSLQNITKQKDYWLKGYASNLSKFSNKNTKIDFSNKLNLSKTGKYQLATINMTYNKKSETDTKILSINAKINETNVQEITLPTKILKEKDTTLKSLHTETLTLLEKLQKGNLHKEEEELTPEQMISISKLVRPSQDDNFKYKVYQHYVSITEYIGSSSSVSIPDNIEELPVLVIEDNAFKKAQVTSIIVPDSIIVIGEGAFQDCANLVDLKLSRNLTEIPNSMCTNCKLLKNIEIPYGVKVIGERAFNNCIAFTEIAIPATVQLIDSNAFDFCSSVKTVVIMDGNIYDKDNTYIKTVGLTIDSYAFANSEIKTVVLPETIVSIHSSAFTPKQNTTVKTMFYGYSPSQGSMYCANNKYLFTTISSGGNIDTAIKSDIETALKVAKNL